MDDEKYKSIKQAIKDYDKHVDTVFSECPHKIVVFERDDYLIPRLEWICDNITGRWDKVNLGCDVVLCFSNINDFLQFKLVWGGHQSFFDVYNGE